MKLIKGFLGLAAFATVATMIGACGTDNVAACEDYITKVNTLECYKAAAFTFDCSIYEETDCDISEYFTCVTDATKCSADGMTPDVTGVAACVDKATCQ